MSNQFSVSEVVPDYVKYHTFDVTKTGTDSIFFLGSDRALPSDADALCNKLEADNRVAAFDEL